ncbi:MAG: alpha/beta fold hydrolase, partial [Rubrivivax sp.]
MVVRNMEPSMTTHNPAAAFFASPAARGIAAVLRGLHRVSPALGTRLAMGLFFTPVPTKWLARSRAVPRPWVERQLPFEGGHVSVWQRGDIEPGRPKVLLTHGWAGDAQQMRALADTLAADGFEPVLLDLPAHGRSSGWRSNLLQWVRAMFAVTARFGPWDGVVAHSLGAMALMFVCIFVVADVPMGWIEQGAAWLSEQITNRMAESNFRSLITDGVIAGVSGVVIFLPQILILYLFLGFLEDSGYMARAAFIMDRLMSRVGLHGKSFIPLLSSFACAIPGIMATRTVENRKDRLVTILVAPLMSCSARIPVYTIMIAVLLPTASLLQKAGIMLSMYMVGIVAAFGMAWLFK